MFAFDSFFEFPISFDNNDIPWDGRLNFSYDWKTECSIVVKILYGIS